MQMLPFSRGLIVTCQAYPGEPMYGATIMAALARAAVEGGAIAVHSGTPEDLIAIRAAISLPLIGIYKNHQSASEVYITDTHAKAQAISLAGCDVIQIDGTPRPRQDGQLLAEQIAFIHDILGKPVLAGVSCLTDALASVEAGADAVSTFLAGYTTHGRPFMDGPDFEVLAQILAQVSVPVIAEGRFKTPEQCAQAMQMGSYGVLVGSAITDPRSITKRFVASLTL